MDKTEQVKIQIELPTTILKPGQIIQFQREMLGEGDQIHIELEQITNVSFEWNGEDEKFNRNVFYSTLSGKTIGYDLRVGNWWLCQHWRLPNANAPINVFPI